MPPGPMATQSAGLLKLNAAVPSIENLQSELSEFRQKTQRAIDILVSQNRVLTAELEEAQKRIDFLESLLGIVSVDSDGNAMRSSENVEENEGEGGRIGACEETLDDEERKNQQSIEAADSKVMKDTVNAVFKHLIGVRSISGKHLPAYPYGIDQENLLWPKDHTTKKPLIRFMWRETPSHPKNANAVKQVVASIKSLGPTLHPACSPLLAKVHDADLEDRVVKKLNYLRSEWRKVQKKEAAGNTNDGSSDEDGNEDDEDPFGGERGDVSADGVQNEQHEPCEMVSESNDHTHRGHAQLDRAAKYSRATSKLAARERKRVGSVYADPKYDAAFTKNAMSDDEDDPDSIGASGKATQWISRAPDYRSEVLQKLYNEIDAHPDPAPEKEKAATERSRGPVIIGSRPDVTRDLNLRIRSWMVRPELLQANPQWLISNRVAASGVLWGDAEDPVEETSKKCKKDGGMGDPVTGRQKRRLIDNSAIAQSKAQLADLLGGEDIETSVRIT